MLKNSARLNKFYKKLMENEGISYKKALLIYEALHREAVSLGVINSRDILDGLEVDIKIARALNCLDR